MELANNGVKKLLVIEPTFVADCLEILVEIATWARDVFRAAWSEERTQLPWLNADDA